MLDDEEPTLDDRPLISPRHSGLLLQGVFSLMFAVSTLILLALEPEVVTHAHFTAGAGFVVVASALLFLPAFRDPWYRPWMLALPVLDYLAVAIARVDDTGGITNPLILTLAIPAVAVGLMRSRGALLGFIPATLAVVAPDALLVIDGRLDVETRERTILIIALFPTVMMLVAAVAYVMATIIADRQSTLAESQRRQAAAALETERTRGLFEAVLDELDVGVVVLSPDGGRILMNRVLRESPVLTAGGGDPWTSFLTVRVFGVDRVTPIAGDDTAMRRVIRGERVDDRISWVGAPGSDQTALSVSAAPVHGRDGGHLANVIRINDVTSFVQAIEAKDAFIATVSHELRTPLTTLAGFLELIMERRGEFDPEVVEWLEVMERNIRRQELLVRDLLTVAGSRTTSVALARRESDLAAVAREAASALRKEASAKGLRLAVRGRDVRARFDPARLAQVAENLISNAIRYTPDGGRVGVMVRHEGDHVTLTVTDTGIGISADDQERLFEQFFRGAHARQAAIRGVGLGLPIVKAIVEAHGGTIDLYSALGRGTTVTVRIPQTPPG